MCAVYGVTAFIFYPETQGYSLEQMAVIFDGDEADVLEPSETFRKASVVNGIVKKQSIPVLETMLKKYNLLVALERLKETYCGMVSCRFSFCCFLLE